MISYDLSQGEVLEQQFESMFNMQLDDYESNLQHLMRKKEIFEGEGEDQASARDQFDKEIRERTESFKKRMCQLIEESDLLQRHMEFLSISKMAYESDRLLPSVNPVGDLSNRIYSIMVSFIHVDANFSG